MENQQLQNRYPGSRAFMQSEHNIFKGRHSEVKKLNNLIDIEKIVVLYGNVGCGKTSLVNAGLIPMNEWDGKPNIIHFSFENIQPIDTFVRSLLGGRPKQCTFASSCLKRMVSISPAGDIIPCGSFTAAEYVLGNIFTRTLISCLASDRARALRRRKARVVARECSDCPYVTICRGVSRVAAFWHTGSFERDYPYCAARRWTFDHIQHRLTDILKKSQQQRTQKASHALHTDEDSSAIHPLL